MILKQLERLLFTGFADINTVLTDDRENKSVFKIAIQLESEFKRTPLIEAIKNNNVQMILLLLENKAIQIYLWNRFSIKIIVSMKIILK